MRLFAGIVLIIIVALVVVAISWAINSYWFEDRRRERDERAWRHAVTYALWEPQTIESDGQTAVRITRVARLGDRQEVVDLGQLLNQFSSNHPEWEEKYEAAMHAARGRCIALNWNIETMPGFKP